MKYNFLPAIRRLFTRAIIFTILFSLAFQLIHGIKPALAAATLVATKTDGLINDVNGDLQANPGDTLQYTITIQNTGDSNATNTVFNDTIDPNTTFAPGSLETTPIISNDSYSTAGNVQLTTIVSLGVLINDSDLDGSGGLAVSSYSPTSANGGNVSMAVDGSFTYNPPAGFSGTDTFTYTASDGESNMDSATVTITVGTPVWFINNSVAGPGDGRFTSPFSSIANFNSLAADEAGDYIFVYTGAGAYSGTITLLNSQQLIGNGVAFNLSPNLSISAGSRPTVANITLALGNTVRGLNVSTNTGTGISGANVGSLTINNVSVNNTNGVGVSLTNGNGSMSVTFDSVSSSGGANGIVLTNNSGSFTSNGGTIDPTTGHGISVSNNAAGPLNFTLTNSTITGAPSGFNGINFDISSSGSFGTILIQSNTISNNLSAGLNMSVAGTGTVIKIDVGSNNSFSGNYIGINLSANGTASMDFDIHNNTLNGTSTQVNVSANDTSANNGVGPTMEGYIRSNNITSSSTGNTHIALSVISTGDGNITTDINTNTINNFGDSGINVQSIGGTGDVNARIANNSATTTASLPYTAMYLGSGDGTAGETSLLCVNLSNNNMNGSATALADYILARPSPATSNIFQIQGLSPSSTTAAVAQSYVISTDSAAPATALANTGTYTAATCATVSFVALPSQPQVASELDKTSPLVTDQIPVWNDALTSLRNSASNWVSGLIHNLGVSTAHASGENVNINLGTLNAGQSVTITFNVTVDNPLVPSSTTQVCNQSSITADGGINILTDDPDVVGASDSTCTPVFTIAGPTLQVDTFISQAVQDGRLLESSETSDAGGWLDSTATTFVVGDDNMDRQYRSILHFDTSALPDNAVITKAVLAIKRQGITGSDPFLSLGLLQVDMRSPDFGAPTLELSDFSAAPAKTNVGSFSSSLSSAWHRAVLNNPAERHINLFGSTQFRISFALDDNDNNSADFIRFNSGNSAVGNHPKLIITYYVP